jgi:hypothetical protein
MLMAYMHVSNIIAAPILVLSVVKSLPSAAAPMSATKLVRSGTCRNANLISKIRLKFAIQNAQKLLNPNLSSGEGSVSRGAGFREMAGLAEAIMKASFKLF